MTGLRQHDTREEAATRDDAALVNAKKCPVCKDVHMFNNRKHNGIKIPSKQLHSCERFKQIIPERNSIVIEEQSG